MTPSSARDRAGGGVLSGRPALPRAGAGQYVLHVLIQIFIWSFIGQAWSLMGRFGLVSLGHGAFLGIGAYTVALLWNFFRLTPWIGALIAVVRARRCSPRWSRTRAPDSGSWATTSRS